jgi:hypothetical protein
MVVLDTLPMMDPDHGSVGLKGIIMLASHTSKTRSMDRRQWKISASPL